jgi:hypothetical protein
MPTDTLLRDLVHLALLQEETVKTTAAMVVVAEVVAEAIR